MNIREIGILDFTKEELYGGMDKHHIVFRSQGGVNHDYNIIDLPHGFHIGDRGPHLNHDMDQSLKCLQQIKLFKVFGHDEMHTMDEILEIIHPWDKESRVSIEKKLRWKIGGYIEQVIRNKKEKNVYPENTEKTVSIPVYRSEEIVRVLMGGHLY